MSFSATSNAGFFFITFIYGYLCTRRMTIYMNFCFIRICKEIPFSHPIRIIRKDERWWTDLDLTSQSTNEVYMATSSFHVRRLQVPLWAAKRWYDDLYNLTTMVYLTLMPSISWIICCFSYSWLFCVSDSRIFRNSNSSVRSNIWSWKQIPSCTHLKNHTDLLIDSNAADHFMLKLDIFQCKHFTYLNSNCLSLAEN